MTKKAKAPKKKLKKTDIIVVLDRSGSMSAIVDDMKGGFDTLIAEQKDVPGRCDVSLYQFDDRYEAVYESLDIKDVPNLELVPRGMTALFDAVGKTINSHSEKLSKVRNKPQVLFVIITDGQNNSSKEYSAEQIKKLITEKSEDGWQFVYLGSDEKGFEDAANMGIAASMTVSFDASEAGTRQMAKGLSAGIRSYRSIGSYIDPNANPGTPDK